jgi:hypothetical protein
MYIWLTAPTFAYDDWRIEVVLSFIDALALMVGDWHNLSSFDVTIYLVVGFSFYFIPFDGMFLVEPIWVFIYPSEVLQLVCDCLPYSPFQWPFHPNLGFWVLTSLMILFSQGECPNMFMRSRTILPSISKSLSFHLIGFWRLWLFNHTLTFTLPFPTLNSMYWHGTKGNTSLDVSWGYVSTSSQSV